MMPKVGQTPKPVIKESAKQRKVRLIQEKKSEADNGVTTMAELYKELDIIRCALHENVTIVSNLARKLDSLTARILTGEVVAGDIPVTDDIPF